MPVKIVGRQTIFSLNGFWRIVKQFQRNLFNYYVYKVQNARMGAFKSWFAATKLIPSTSIERKKLNHFQILAIYTKLDCDFCDKIIQKWIDKMKKRYYNKLIHKQLAYQ